MNTRVCKYCSLEKTKEDFCYPEKGNQCKDCNKKLKRERTKKERALGKHDKYKGKYINSEKREEYILDWRYNISKEDYDNLLKKQEFSCAICKRHISNFKRKLNVDHNHITNKVRGLLCTQCNTGLGKLGDNIEGLTKALNYLKEND